MLSDSLLVRTTPSLSISFWNNFLFLTKRHFCSLWNLKYKYWHGCHGLFASLYSSPYLSTSWDVDYSDRHNTVSPLDTQKLTLGVLNGMRKYYFIFTSVVTSRNAISLDVHLPLCLNNSSSVSGFPGHNMAFSTVCRISLKQCTPEIMSNYR